MSAILVGLLVTLFAAGYMYVKRCYSYWERRGIPFKVPTFPFGNLSGCILSKKSFDEEIVDLYNETDEPYIGFYALLQPNLLLRDSKIIKEVMIKNFQSFYHSGWQSNWKTDPMASNILLQKGDKWTTVRRQMTPAFSSGKLREMFDLIVHCGRSLDKHVDKFADTSNTVEVRELLARFGTNVIVTVGFGIEIDAIAEPDCIFRQYGARFFQPTFKNLFRMVGSLVWPKLSEWLQLRFTDKDIGDFMIDTVKQNVEYREKNNITRKDIFQLLMQLRNTGKIDEDNNDWTTKANSNQEKAISLEELAAQVFFFFVGGYESSSSAVSFLMYELAKNQDIQQKVYDEMDGILGKYDGKMTYDGVAEMKYLDHCFTEALRMYPPFATLHRRCNQTCKLPDTDIIVEEGTLMNISILAVHYDPRFYDEPKKFKPERFSGASKDFVEMPFLSFGEGPRKCIATRMGRLQSKIALIALLRKFRFELADEHMDGDLKYNPVSFVLAPVNGINLKAFKR